MSSVVNRNSWPNPTHSSVLGPPVGVCKAPLKACIRRPTRRFRSVTLKLENRALLIEPATMLRRACALPSSHSIRATRKMASSGFGSARSSPNNPQKDWNGTWCVSGSSTSPKAPYTNAREAGMGAGKPPTLMVFFKSTAATIMYGSSAPASSVSVWQRKLSKDM